MKVNRGFGNRGQGPMDLDGIFNEIFEAAREFHDEFSKNFAGNLYTNPADENIDYYPNYSYPPMNIYMTGDRILIFEFALAGFEEKDISLSFHGDYMVFSAVMSSSEKAASADEVMRYFKRRLKMKDIEKQKYFVPLDKYAQDQVKAVFRNGILRVSIPPKTEPEQNDGIKIEIVTES